MIKRLFTVALLFAGAVHAQNVDKLIKQPEVERLIKTLSADDMEGRGTFTPGIQKAAQFIAGEFKTIGLKPLPSEANYLQSFTATRSKPLSIAATVNGKAVPADSVFARASDSFDWKTGDAEVATIAAGEDFWPTFSKYIQSESKTVILVDPSFAKMFNNVRKRVMEGAVSIKPNTGAGAVFILGNFGKAESYTVSFKASTEKLPLFNVAGVIPGKTKPNEFVIFSGHYDHLGVGHAPTVEGDSIANGADDDASGTTAVISLAKYYKALNNNARTLIFVAFTAEEIGGYGSQYFSSKVDPEKTVAMFNIEMIGKASKFGKNSAFITGYERSDFGKILQKNLKGTAFQFHPDPYPEQQLFYRSDNATLARLGVPAHTISTDQIDTDKLYHTVKDEFESLDVSNITSTIKAIALSSRSIVAGTDAPTRIPKMED